ncbi:MAG: F0F1 ATP synthase subunit epsilon [Alphaproteobacteria bacterium]|nr:F0F1 ATP synthase subunit epsilon [Alphaproteobacteria bacterium]MBV9418522.1 F0F1 ATP synthase subunit epsilon [Alphaproteobacteria bacterium]MBV9542150.1 F0F1 ATP synthase subunit epsilon [Alphaproteobacteria bacterium]
MAAKIAFDLVSPERLLLSDEADMVTVPGTEGYMGVMAGHAPLVTTLRIGMIDVSNNGTDTRFFIRGGFAEIGPAKINILAEEAVPMAELDLAVLDQRIKDAEEDLLAAADGDKARAAATLDDLRLVRAAF